MRKIFTIFLLSISTLIFSQSADYDFEELKFKIENILDEKDVPGAQFIVVNRDSILMKLNYGFADVKNDIPVTDSTLFRIGSISKSFVAVSIMQLVEQGLISLNDKVSDVVPEVPFTNQWESTDPVRLVNVLEHTTGFDDIHLTEYAANADGWSTLDGLTYHPHSRTSRYKPGMFASYCNGGPPIAAYTIEKISGKTFEDYVKLNVFDPLGMENSGFFNDTYTQAHLSKGYSNTDLVEAPYWHILARSSGSVNSTAIEMSKYVRFFLNHGLADSTRVLDSLSVVRIGKPESTLSAKNGCTTGYGLCLMNKNYNGITYYGHSGGLDGFLSDLIFIPELNIGYFFSINLGSGAAFGELFDITQDFFLSELSDTSNIEIATSGMLASDLSGYYRSASSRNQTFRLADWLRDIFVIKEKDGKLYRSKPLRETHLLYHDGNHLLYKDDRGLFTPITFSEKDDRVYMQLPGHMGNYYKVSCFAVWWQLVVAILCLGFIASSIILGVLRVLIWIFSKKKRKNKLEKLSPIIASILSILWTIPLLLGMNLHPLERFGNPTIYSVSITIITVLFAIASVFALLVSLRSFMVRMNKFYRIYFLLVSISCVVVAIYLFHWNWIGVRFWVF